MKTNWLIKKLGEVVQIQNGFAFKSSEYVNSGFFVMRITNVQDGYIELNNPKYIQKTNKQFDKFILNKGDTLMSLTGNVGRVGVIQEEHLPAMLNQRVARISISNGKELDKNYLFYFLRSPKFFAEVIEGGHGMAQQNVSTKDIENLEIPLPSLETQKKIVKMLDEKMGKIGEAKRLRAEALADTEKILPQTLHEIFEEGRKKGWEEMKVSDIAEIKGGKRLPKGEKLTNEKTAHPYLRVTDFKNGILKIDGIRFLDEKTFEQIKRYTISSKDIFVSIAGTIGLICLIPKEFDGASLTENAAKITSIDKSIDKNFLFWQLQTQAVQKEFVGKSIQTTISKLALYKIADQNILVPPLPEQQKIVAKLDALSEKVRTLRDLQTAQLADLKSLERAYLREAFRGEL